MIFLVSSVAGAFVSCDLHQFDGLHAAEAANVADDGPAALPFAGAALEAVAEFVGASEQILALEQIEHGQGCGAGERIAGEGSAEAAGAGSIHDFGAAGNGG